MGGHIHGVKARVKHAVWHEDVATATILEELPFIQVHWLVLGREGGRNGHIITHVYIIVQSQYYCPVPILPYAIPPVW